PERSLKAEQVFLRLLFRTRIPSMPASPWMNGDIHLPMKFYEMIISMLISFQRCAKTVIMMQPEECISNAAISFFSAILPVLLQSRNAANSVSICMISSTIQLYQGDCSEIFVS